MWLAPTAGWRGRGEQSGELEPRRGGKEALTRVEEKLISRSKKEMESFIQASFEDCNLGRTSQKALRTVPPVRSQGTGI